MKSSRPDATRGTRCHCPPGRAHCLASALIVLLPLVVSPASGQTAGSAAILGTVVDDSGAPVAGAVVHYGGSPKYQKASDGHLRVVGPVVASHVVSAKDGTFSVADLPPYVYYLCADGTLPTHLSSCSWGRGSTKVDLTTASSASGIKLQVMVGVLMTFNVQDSGGQVNDFAATPAVSGKPAPSGNFRIFVFDASHYMAAAKLASATGGVHQYTLAVPKNRSLSLFMDTHLTVNDATPTMVESGKLARTVATAELPVTVQFTIP